jgi:phage tail sheath protein FI
MSRIPLKPGVFVQEIKIYPPPIEGVNTSNVAFLGETETGPTTPTLVTSFIEYQRVFGGYFGECKYLPYAVEGFFLNGGRRCYVCRVADSNYTSALAKLEVVDVSIIYSPNAQTEPGLTNALINHCEQLRNRFLILDSLKGQNPSSVTKPSVSSFAALYYPWIYVKEATKGQLCLVPLGGHVAGIYARMDIEVGVHMAPANQIVKGAVGLEVTMKSYQIDSLSSQGINTVRNFAGRGLVVWGARTLSIDPTKKFVSFCRLMIYLEQSIKKGIAWTVFEPNNEITWVKVKTSIENFLTQAWRSGMLLGIKQQEAFFVECGRNTMTQDDIDNGRLIVLIGVAPIKPAEFVILSISQKTAVS